MSISAGSDETKVGMARSAVPAAFSGGTLGARMPRMDGLVKRPFRACTARERRSAASLPSLPGEISGNSRHTLEKKTEMLMNLVQILPGKAK